MTNIMDNFQLIDHPLLKRDMTILRNKNTEPESFRAAVKRIATILAVETSKEILMTNMVSGFLGVIPEAKVGHIGLQRDETTLLPTEYYYKTPKNLEKSKVILLDPMLATGGSAAEALKYLKKRGALDIVFVCLVASPIGVQKVLTMHPNVKIIAAAYDRELNEKGYILPGLGDAGDRTFGTL
jgi:uracil phosphoribosyltransferase